MVKRDTVIVVLQAYDLPGIQVFSVSQIIVHENYNSPITYDNDIALLILSTPVVFSHSVSPVCLSTHNPTTDDDLCFVTGWGDTKNPNEEQNLLRQVSVPVYNQEECNKDYDGQITDNMVCAGYAAGGKDSCQGDSGGPFVCIKGGKWYLQGVVSFGEGCADPNMPGIYARVFNYKQWIDDNINSAAVSSSRLPTTTTKPSQPSTVTAGGSQTGNDDSESSEEEDSLEEYKNSNKAAQLRELLADFFALKA